MNELVFQRKRCEAVKVYITNENGNFYDLQIGEWFVFGVKKTEADTSYSINKEITANDKVVGENESYYLLTLSSTETNIPAGYYHYDIVLQDANEKYPCVRYGDCVIIRAVVE